jgi:anaerobic selenocysteine-containing dehydrogenase
VQHRSFCRICAAACGIVVTTEGERVVQVRGDAEHPVSRGYTCPKGRALPEFHHRPDRLDQPTLDGTTTTWSTALDDLGSRLAETVAVHGPGSVGFYLGTGLAYDIAGWLTAERLIATLGTPQRYTPVTIDNAPALLAAELVGGSSQLNPVWQPEHSDVLLLFGTNPVVSHGYGTTLADPVRRLRQFQSDGGQVWVLDPRRTETAALADHHLPLRAGTDHLVLAWLVREVLTDGADTAELDAACHPTHVAALRAALAPFDRRRVANATGVDPDDLDALLATVRSSPGRVASMAGTGVMMSAQGLVAEWLRWVLLIVTGSLDRGGAMRFNDGLLFPLEERLRAPAEPVPPPAGPRSRPELSGWAGQYPCVAMADEIRGGHLRALVVAGGSPLTAFPDPAGIRGALRSLDTLAVLDVAATPLTAMASHVLPVAGQLERADLSMLENVAFRNGTAFTPAVVRAGAQRRAAWWVLAQLARRLGVDALGRDRDPDALADTDVLRGLARGARVPFDDIVANGAHGTTSRPGDGWVHDRVLHDGRWNLAPRALLDRLTAIGSSPDEPPSPVLVPRRQVHTVNATVYGTADPARAVLNPLDATDAGLAEVPEGATIRLTTSAGWVEGELARDTGIARGTVALTHGRAGLLVSELIGAVDAVDPLTGMPRASGVPVTLTVAAADPPGT